MTPKSITITGKLGWACSALIGALILFVSIIPVRDILAHDDPGGCFSNGVTLSIAVYRADGTTPVGGGSVQSGEIIKYGATLSHAGGSNCNFEGGTLTITTPDGIPHVVASGAGIPLVSSGSPFVAPQQSYVVNEADVNGGFLSAVANYAGGESHTPTLHQNAQAQVDISNLYQDVVLEVTKTAVPASEVTYGWTIDKSVSPATWNLFTGDSGTSEYTITLTKSTTTSEHSVTGTITIHNPAQFASANITSVLDAITGVGAVTVVCPGGLPQLLAPGANLVCTYSSSLPDGTTRTNTATVTTSGDVGGSMDDASIDFTGIMPSQVNGTVNVNDTNNAGDGGPFSSSTQYSYERAFTCDADEGVHNNTATIVETQASDSAAVTVNCHSLTVQKTAATTFDRTYQWTVDKDADATDITFASGQSYDIHYTVVASVTGTTDSNWNVNGTITVHNPAPIAATINTVSDVVSGAGAAMVNCGPAVFPYTLGPGANLVCTYSKALPDGTNRTNTATATRQAYQYNPPAAPVPAGTMNTSGNAAVNFGAPANIVDEQVTVTDSFAGALGTATVAESPKSFHYTRTVSFTTEQCGDHTVENTATITTNDTDATMNDSHIVEVRVNCPGGCTHTPSYWRTHPEQWPVDSLKLGNIIYTKSQLLMILKWTGNSSGTLAHELIAAKLNIASGADGADIAATITAADTLIGNKKFPPFGLGLFSASQANPLIKALSKYNKGVTGPGNCECLCLKDGETKSCTP